MTQRPAAYLCLHSNAASRLPVIPPYGFIQLSVCLQRAVLIRTVIVYTSPNICGVVQIVANAHYLYWAVGWCGAHP